MVDINETYSSCRRHCQQSDISSLSIESLITDLLSLMIHEIISVVKIFILVLAILCLFVTYIKSCTVVKYKMTIMIRSDSWVYWP